MAAHPPLLRTAAGTGFPLHVLTKSALVLRDFDLFAGRPVQVGVTLTTLDERLRALGAGDGER